MSQPLFIKPTTPSLEKRAYSIRLDTDPKEWPISILKEAYKQVPYLRSYEVDVELDRTDDARGYAVGKMLVYPARMKKEAAAKVDRIISFPIIVRDRELSPLDVISHKENMSPADEKTVSSILFKEDMFERPASKMEFGSTGLGAQLDPPSANRIRGAGFQKSASVGLWKAVVPTIKKEDIQKLREDLNQDATIRMAALSNPAFGEVLDQAIDSTEKTAEAIRRERASTLKPTAVQFIKRGRDYFVKTANHNCYNPIEQAISRFEVSDALGPDEFSQLLSNGYHTFTVDPVANSATVLNKVASANRTGIYKTYTSDGSSVEGIVIPKMVDIDGNEIHSQLFIGDGFHSMQEKVAGVYKSDTTLPDNNRRGLGVFVHQLGPMSVATEPFEILNQVTETAGVEKLAYFNAKRAANGLPIRITPVPGLQKIASIGDYDLAIPESMKFISLNPKVNRVHSDTSSVEMSELQKVSSDRQVELISDGSAYQIKGSPAFNKISDRTETSWMLANLGLSRKQSEHAMDKAASAGSYRILKTRNVVPEEDLQYSIMTSIALPNVDHLRKDLIKEASVIVDKETVDSLLSLRFLTPDNVGVFVNYIPELEKVSSKLAEVLTASRLGLDEVKESAAKNAMSQVMSVINGLKDVQSKIS